MAGVNETNKLQGNKTAVDLENPHLSPAYFFIMANFNEALVKLSPITGLM